MENHSIITDKKLSSGSCHYTNTKKVEGKAKKWIALSGHPEIRSFTGKILSGS